jgi:hypothetical protein
MKKMFLLLLTCVLTLAVSAQSGKDKYVGVYKFPDGSVVTTIEVVLQDSALSMSSSAGASPLTWIQNDEFSVVNFNGTAVFKRNTEGRVVGVHIEAMGYILDGVKQDAVQQAKWSDKLLSQWRGCSPNNGVVAPFLLKPITQQVPLIVSR